MKALRLLPLILLSSCGGPSEPEQGSAAEAYRNGRDGLCLAGEGEALRAGLITYGPENSNCSLSGAAVENGDRLVISPRGDAHCRVEVRMAGETAVVGPRGRECAYYCGPGADFSGKVLRRSSDPAPVTDFAGDPLC